MQKRGEFGSTRKYYTLIQLKKVISARNKLLENNETVYEKPKIYLIIYKVKSIGERNKIFNENILVRTT
jgi:hypothetical protein